MKNNMNISLIKKIIFVFLLLMGHQQEIFASTVSTQFECPNFVKVIFPNNIELQRMLYGTCCVAVVLIVSTLVGLSIAALIKQLQNKKEIELPKPVVGIVSFEEFTKMTEKILSCENDVKNLLGKNNKMDSELEAKTFHNEMLLQAQAEHKTIIDELKAQNESCQVQMAKLIALCNQQIVSYKEINTKENQSNIYAWENIKKQCEEVLSESKGKLNEAMSFINEVKKLCNEKIEKMQSKFETQMNGYASNIKEERTKIEEYNNTQSALIEDHKNNLVRLEVAMRSAEEAYNKELSKKIIELKKELEEGIKKLLEEFQEKNKLEIHRLQAEFEAFKTKEEEKNKEQLAHNKTMLDIVQGQLKIEQAREERQLKEYADKQTEASKTKELLENNSSQIQLTVVNLQSLINKLVDGAVQEFENVRGAKTESKLVDREELKDTNCKTNNGRSVFENLFEKFGEKNPTPQELMVYSIACMSNPRQESMISTSESTQNEKSQLTQLTASQLVFSPLVQMQLDELIGAFESKRIEIGNNPEKHPMYVRNAKEIKKLCENLNEFIENLNPEKINAQTNENYLKLTEVQSYKDLFEKSREILGIEFRDEGDELIKYLSKTDKDFLEKGFKVISNEKKLREKEEVRKYKYYENDLQSNIIKYRINITNKIKEIGSEDFTQYEKFAVCDKEIESPSGLLLKEEKIKDEDREIIDILLQKDFQMYKDEMKIEAKKRLNDPHRCSMYKKNEEDIKNYLATLKKIVGFVSQENQNEITEKENETYEKLIQSIEFEKEYIIENFIRWTMEACEVKFDDVEQIVTCLNKIEKTAIEDKYRAIQKERIERTRNPARQHQWYYNEEKINRIIDELKKKINAIKQKIEKNEENDHTYEEYASILERGNEFLLSQLSNNHLEITLEINKIELCLREDLDELKKVFVVETQLRTPFPERCYIGKKNKNTIIAYHSTMKEFFTALVNLKTIDRELNKRYIMMEKMIQKVENDDVYESFFIGTMQLFEINLAEGNFLQVYKNGLSVSDKITIQKYYEKVQLENQLRRQDKTREYQWYINETKLTEKIKSINGIIQNFIKKCKQEVFDKEEMEKLYLSGIKDVQLEHSLLIKELFSKEIESELEQETNIDYSKLIEHVNIKILVESIQKEKEKRAERPMRSYYYSTYEKIIQSLMENVECFNKILGQDKAETTENANNFYDWVAKKYEISALSNNISIDFAQSILTEFLKNKLDDNIGYILSKKQLDAVCQLMRNCKAEHALRGLYASRGLSLEDKNILIQFRKWLENIKLILSANNLSCQKEQIDKCGNGCRSFTDNMLYQEFCLKSELFNTKELLLDRILKNFDQLDKEKMNAIKGLLNVSFKFLESNAEAVQKEKRLFDNVKSVNQLMPEKLSIDDEAEEKRVKELEDKIVEYDTQVKLFIQKKDLEIKKQQDELLQQYEKKKIQVDQDYERFYSEDLRNEMQKKLIMKWRETNTLKNYKEEKFYKNVALKIFLQYDNFLENNHIIYDDYLKIKDYDTFKNFIDQVNKIKKININNRNNQGLFILFNYFDALIDESIDSSINALKVRFNLYLDMTGFKDENIFIFDNDKISLAALITIYTQTNKLFNNLSYNQHMLQDNDFINFFQKNNKTISVLRNDFRLNEYSIKRVLFYLKNTYAQCKEKNMLRFDNSHFECDQNHYDALKNGASFIFKAFLNHEELSNYAINYDRENITAKYKILGSVYQETVMRTLNKDYSLTWRNYIEKSLLSIEESNKVPSSAQGYKDQATKNYIGYDFFFDDKQKGRYFNRDAIKNNLDLEYDLETQGIKKQCDLEYKKSIEELEKSLDIKSINAELRELNNIIQAKKCRMLLSEKDIDRIPFEVIEYQFKIYIANKIKALLEMDNNNLEEILSGCKKEKLGIGIDIVPLNYDEKLEELYEQQLFNLYKIVLSINNNNLFINYIVKNINDIKNVVDLKKILKLVLDDFYNTNTSKAHFLFNGEPGTGKSAFMQFAIVNFMNKIKNQELKKYLQEKIRVFFISKGYYGNQATVDKGLSGDIATIIFLIQGIILLVQYDECDDLVNEKDNQKSNADTGEINTLLTMIDQSSSKPFSFFGTTNKDAFEASTIRRGRLSLINVQPPSKEAIRGWLKNKSNDFLLLANHSYDESMTKKNNQKKKNLINLLRNFDKDYSNILMQSRKKTITFVDVVNYIEESN